MKRFFASRIFFLAAKRTAFGQFLGSLAPFSATDLGVHAAKAAITAATISPHLIDHVVFGNVLQTAKDAIYLARHIGLRVEAPVHAPAVTLNRLCGSGFEAIIQGARLLSSQEAHCVLVGGAENMSQSPHVIYGARTGLALAKSQLSDSLWDCLHDSFVNLPMAITAENLAEQYKISQDEVDHFSVVSQQKYQEAKKCAAFDEEIAPIDIKGRIFNTDEHPRENTTIEKLRTLPKVFKKDGVIHAGAASGITDGAAALIMCNEEFLQRHSLKPLGELISFGITGCDPKIMGIGPVMAIKQALQKIDLTLDDMSMIEINEAFAPQVLAVKKELGISDDKLNIHGGAIAIGHPLAASGARIATHVIHNLQRTTGQYGLGSACIGGGQGIATIFKTV